MSNIISEFKTLLKNNTIKGLYKWYKNYGWQKRGDLRKFIRTKLSSIEPKNFSELDEYKRSSAEIDEFAKNIKFGFKHYNIIEQTIIYLILEDSVSVLHMKNTEIKIELLDDESIDEVILFYNLKNPTKRYKEIKAAINSPRRFLTYIPYSVINGLYKKGKVPFDRQIFVACLIRYNVWNGAAYKKELSPENAKNFTTYFPQDAFTLDILLAVFEMELGVDSAFYLDEEHNIAAVIFALIKNGKYTKTQIQQKIFEAFNNPLLKRRSQSWMKDVYNDLELTVEENIATQEQIIGLLLNDVNLIANHAIKLIKTMAKNPKFDWQLLVNSLEGIVYREKMNTGLKTILTLLLTKFKKDLNLLEECCVNLAPIFLQTDAKVQIAAKKIYKLLPESQSVKEALLPFTDTMHSEVKKELSYLVGEETNQKIELETYKQQTYKPEKLTTENELKYIETEDDFVFLTSKVLKSHNFEDYELFLEGLVRFHTIKNTRLKELKPALKQAKKYILEFGGFSARLGIHHRMIALLITVWLDTDFNSIEDKITTWKKDIAVYVLFFRANEWLTNFKQFTRVRDIALKIRTNTPILPFLSISTHKNGAIHPTIFLERLQQYMDANVTPNQGDFDLALCRLSRNTSFKTINSSQTEHQKIVNYLLEPKALFNPKEIDKLESSWLTAFALKNPKSALKNILEFRNHKKEFFDKTNTWDWSLKQIDGKWAKLDLQIDYITNNTLRKNRLPTIMPLDNHFSSYFDINTFFVADASHWFARNPFYLEPLYLKTIQNSYKYLSDMDADDARDIMAIVVQSANAVKPIGKAGYLFLVISLFSKDNSIRMATLDWLLQLIENAYLDVNEFKHTVTKILANQVDHFIPTTRVCEQFDQLLQLEGVYLDVLDKTLEELIPKMNPTNLPRGFSKILHYYYEVNMLTLNAIPKNVINALEEMKKNNSVKKIAIKILKK